MRSVQKVLQDSMQAERPSPELSPREKQLLEFAAEGLTDTAIAARLGISEATVGTYWGRVRIKLGPYSRTELVAIVMRAERETALEALRLQNEQLVQELQSQTTSGDLDSLSNFLDSAPDSMILVSATGSIQHANNSACELFGYEKGELEGEDLTALVPARFRDKHREHRADYASDPKRRQMGQHLETPALRKDGSEFLIRAALSSIQKPNGLLVICAIRAVETSK